MEVPVRVELTLIELQSIALPLGYGTSATILSLKEINLNNRLIKRLSFKLRVFSTYVKISP